jgi:hypothetical protein
MMEPPGYDTLTYTGPDDSTPSVIAKNAPSIISIHKHEKRDREVRNVLASLDIYVNDCAKDKEDVLLDELHSIVEENGALMHIQNPNDTIRSRMNAIEERKKEINRLREELQADRNIEMQEIQQYKILLRHKFEEPGYDYKKDQELQDKLAECSRMRRKQMQSDRLYSKLEKHRRSIRDLQKEFGVEEVRKKFDPILSPPFPVIDPDRQ